jgi:hypothetical protein
MNDPTHFCLEYALLDQKVAGIFGSKPYAYTPVLHEMRGKWGVGIAVEDEAGYRPVDGPGIEWDEWVEAEEFCKGMNAHIGLSEPRATDIIGSSMWAAERARRIARKRQRARMR